MNTGKLFIDVVINENGYDLKGVYFTLKDTLQNLKTSMFHHIFEINGYQETDIEKSIKNMRKNRTSICFDYGVYHCENISKKTSNKALTKVA